ncbi:MAG: hypothetical protein WCG12_19160 [Alcaligenaceae bacterium]
MGRRTAVSPFEQFCARLERTCLGSVRAEPSNAHLAKAPQAWLKPVRQEDVAHARALCQEYRVALMLEGGEHPTACTQATLWVSPQPAGATVSLVDSQAGVWRADAGCTVGQLEETGVFAGMALPPELTLAQWFAWPETVRGVVPGAVPRHEAHSLERAWVPSEREVGCEPWSVLPDAVRLVEQVEVLLADGTVEVLGPFGANAQAPLRSLTVQRLVPKLFELAGSDSAQRCAQLTRWPGCYRLDALIATAGHEPNLAQLLFGHQGRLGWMQALWLKRPGAVSDFQRTAQDKASARQLEEGMTAQRGGERAPLLQLGSQLDHELKHILDPLGVFGSNSNLKGLESGS